MSENAENQESVPSVRAALYVDGFNLYHPLHDFNEPFLKWVNLWRLGETIIPRRSQTLVAVKYFTAKRPDDGTGSLGRHATYINALRSANVEDVQGHYIMEPKECGHCGYQSQKPVEKQTDINLALHLILDGLADRYDHAYLLSADSDQAATAKAFRTHLEGKSLTSVAPPNRPVSSNIMQHAHGQISLSKAHIERCVFPEYVIPKTGNPIRRPAAYDPPAWWVHPDNRPAKTA